MVRCTGVSVGQFDGQGINGPRRVEVPFRNIKVRRTNTNDSIADVAQKIEGDSACRQRKFPTGHINDEGSANEVLTFYCLSTRLPISSAGSNSWLNCIGQANTFHIPLLLLNDKRFGVKMMKLWRLLIL